MTVEYISNGHVSGGLAAAMLATGFDPGALRPFVGKDRKPKITVNSGGKPQTLTVNAPATLRRDEWKIFDDAVMEAARPRLRAWSDLRAANPRNIPNAMGKTILEYQKMGDITGATISMDGLRLSEYDRPHFDIGNLPLPIIHKDFQFSLRDLAISRSGGGGLDTTMARLAGRRVAEEVEKLLLGVSSSYSFGGAAVYGYTNLPERTTMNTLMNPTDEDWTPHQFVRELLSMIQVMNDSFNYGPFVLYLSPAWSLYLDDDYSDTAGDNTLRARIGLIEGITSVRTLEYLTGFQAILIQMTPEVAQAITGMDITTVQWESQGGFLLNFKVLCIMVPNLRTDMNGNTAIIHATVPGAGGPALTTTTTSSTTTTTL